MHIIPKSLEVINQNAGYAIWSMHCIGLTLLPFLFIKLFENKIKNNQMNIYICLPPIMMILNLIGGIIPTKWSCFPIIIELILTIYFLFHFSFNQSNLSKKSNFWISELILMFLGFIYISTAHGASSLSYVMYGKYIRVNELFYSNSSNPHHAIEYVKNLRNLPNKEIMGEYLSCYSFFTFLSVGIGFAMSLKNSILMIIPFSIHAFYTFKETKPIGIILFCQLFIHIIYILNFYFSKTREFIKGSNWESVAIIDYTTITMLMVGDIISFFLNVFPILNSIITRNGSVEFSLMALIVAYVLIAVAYFFHSLVIDDINLCIFVAPLVYAASSYVVGTNFAGYLPFIRLYSYEITYLTWTIFLYFWSFSQGFSPTLIKIYIIFIPIASLLVIKSYEGVDWMIIICTIVQFFYDHFGFDLVREKHNNLVSWVMFSGITIPNLAGLLYVGAASGKFDNSKTEENETKKDEGPIYYYESENNRRYIPSSIADHALKLAKEGRFSHNGPAFYVGEYKFRVKRDIIDNLAVVPDY